MSVEAAGGAVFEVLVGVEVLAGGVEVGSVDRSGLVMRCGSRVLRGFGTRVLRAGFEV